jgi:hypothetical protein
MSLAASYTAVPHPRPHHPYLLYSGWTTQCPLCGPEYMGGTHTAGSGNCMVRYRAADINVCGRAACMQQAAEGKERCEKRRVLASGVGYDSMGSGPRGFQLARGRCTQYHCTKATAQRKISSTAVRVPPFQTGTETIPSTAVRLPPFIFLNLFGHRHSAPQQRCALGRIAPRVLWLKRRDHARSSLCCIPTGTKTIPSTVVRLPP